MGIFNLFEGKKIKEEIDNLQQKYDLLKIDFDNKNQEVNEVRIEKIKLFNDLWDKKKEITVLENKIKELEQHRLNLEQDKLNLEQDIVLLKENNKKLENNNLELKQRKQILYREYIKLKKEKNILKEKNQEEEKKNAILNLVKELKKRIFYKQQIINIDKIKKDFTEKLIIVNNEKNELIFLKNDLEEKILRKEKINERIKDELSKALKNNEVLSKETLELKKEIFDIEKSFKILEIEIDKKNIQIQDLTIKIENLTWQNKEKENKILLEKQYIKSLEKENKIEKDIYKNQIKNLKEELSDFEKMYKELENNSKALELEWIEEQKKNSKILKELEDYKNKLAKLEENSKSQENRQKIEVKEDITPIEVSIEDKNIQIDSLEEKKSQEKLKVEINKIDPIEKLIKKQNTFNLKWNNYEEFIKNKDNLIEYLKSFSSEDFQNIYLQVKEREIIKKDQDKFFTNIIIKLKQDLSITSTDVEKIEPLYKELMRLLFNKNEKEKLSLVSEYKSKEVDKVQKNKRGSSNLKWNNHEEFIKNKDNLIEYLKSFSSEDFQNIYLQVKEKGIIKKAQEKYFSNILIRIKWKLPLTSMDIEKIEPLYKELMNQLLGEDKKTSIILEFKDKEKSSKNEKIDKEIMNILF